MSLFGSSKPVRRPVAEIVSGLSGMIEDLDEARGMAATEQAEAEAEIERLAAARAILAAEQKQAGAVTDNLRSLLGMNLDSDGSDDDLTKAIASWKDSRTTAANDDIEV